MSVTDRLVSFPDYQAIKKRIMLKKGESLVIEADDKVYYCPVELAMDIIGGKWRAVILWYLMENTLRFYELKLVITSISERVLTRELRHLEKHRLIQRRVYPEVPPRVEYSLTDFGRKLVPLLEQVSGFGERYADDFGEIKRR